MAQNKIRTADIVDKMVTYAKVQDVSTTSRILGRITGGAGVIEELTAANVYTILGITSSAAELNLLDGVTATTTELNYIDGVTSAIQTQLDGKVNIDQTVGQTIGTTGARLTKLWATDITVTNAITGSVTGNAGTATALQNARTIGGVSFDGTTNITVASATGGFAITGGSLTITRTTEQARIAYDASNYFKITVGSTGNTVFQGVGDQSGFDFIGGGDGYGFSATGSQGTTSGSAGGIITLEGGLGSATGTSAGGDVFLFGGNGGASGGQGGAVELTGGDSVGARLGGRSSFLGGTGGAGGAGGFGQIYGGTGGSSDGKGGPAILGGGAGGATNANGGDVILQAGNKSGSGTDGRIMLAKNSAAITYGTANTPVTDNFAAILDVSNIATTSKTFTFPNVTGTISLIANTETLTNKRIEPRIVSAASYTTDTGSSLSVATCDIFIITAQAGALLFNNPGGTPVQGQKIIIRIKDNGTARALTWDTQFRAMGNALPSTTVLGKTLYLGFIYNSTDTKWDLIATAQEA